jgi:hypothetical protein
LFWSPLLATCSTNGSKEYSTEVLHGVL